MATDPLYGPPKVGGDTLSWCTRCKMELAHVIVSMVASKPARVQCKTCKSNHNYRSGEPAKPKSGKSRTPSVKKTYVKASEYWEQKLAEKSHDDLRQYKPTETYLVGQVIQHAKFGMGIVEEVKQNGKITILFSDGDKILVHGLKP